MIRLSSIENRGEKSSGRLFIECFGTPGVGKTHVGTALISTLRECGVQVQDEALRVGEHARVYRLFRKVFFIFGAACTWVPLIPEFMATVRRVKWRSRLDIFTVIFNWLYVVSLLSNQLKKKEVSVLDQGLFQALWSLIYRIEEQSAEFPDLEGVLDKSLLRLGRPDIVVLVIEADSQTINRRLTQRRGGHNPLKEGHPKAFEHCLITTRNVCNFIEKIKKKESQITVLNVDNSGFDPSGILLEDQLKKLNLTRYR